MHDFQYSLSVDLYSASLMCLFGEVGCLLWKSSSHRGYFFFSRLYRSLRCFCALLICWFMLTEVIALFVYYRRVLAEVLGHSIHLFIDMFSRRWSHSVFIVGICLPHFTSKWSFCSFIHLSSRKWSLTLCSVVDVCLPPFRIEYFKNDNVRALSSRVLGWEISCRC